MDEAIIKDKIVRTVDEKSEELWQAALTIHSNPELGHQEHEAAKLLSGMLESAGFDVDRKVAGMETSFVAERSFGQGDGFTVAILAEYDALPGMGHACGHNLIGTASVGAGLAVLEVVEELAEAGFSGRLLVMGAPAEEGAVDNAGGKVLMVQEGLFEDVDCALMVHPSSTNGIGGRSLAREAMEITYHGKSSHAAASPEKGRNALDAAIQTFNGWNALRQHVTDDVRIHGIITEGGQSPNIVPDLARIRMYARAADVDYLDEVVNRIKDCAEGGARAAGCTVEFRRTANRYANMKPNLTLAGAYADNFRRLGEDIDETLRGGGSTDMGDVSHEVPSIHPYVAIVPPSVAGHSTEFAEAAGSDPGKRGMLLAAKAMAMTVVDCFTDENLQKEMKAEFKRT
ncbi:MAG: M20 family metallopeptidase [Clostridia bacterium]